MTINSAKELKFYRNNEKIYEKNKRILNSLQNLEISEPSPTNSKSTKNNKCMICFNNEPDSVIMECGHGGFFYKYIPLYRRNF